MEFKQPKKLNIDPNELSAILEVVKPYLTKAQYTIINSAFQTLAWLLSVVKDKSCSIAKLRRLVFGKKTENLKNLRDRLEENKEPTSDTKLSSNDPSAISLTSTSEEVSKLPPEDSGKPELLLDEVNPTADPLREGPTKESPKIPTDGEQSLLEPGNQTEKTSEGIDPKPEPEKKKNHGRRPLSDYKVSKITYVFCDHFKPGDICSKCALGRLYSIAPEMLLTLKGNNLFEGEAWAIEGLRCNRCMNIFRATLPKEVATQPKADFSARAIVCLCKYQLGIPLYRLEAWQNIQSLPISDSEMWEWTEDVALILQPVHQALTQIAGSSRVIHNDDTTAKVLDLMAENVLIKKEEALNPKIKQKDKKRVGIYTTALLAKQDDHEIAIYVTGRKNAGENLDDLMDNRSKDLEKPVQACDASTSNKAERHETVMAKCFNHARHNFCEILEFWPKECLTIIELMNEVFMNDRKTNEMTPEDRQKYHEKNSTSIVERIKTYSNNLLNNKIVEPNSNLGKAIAYLNNHWEGLTLFLKNGEAPLTNNDCERTVKSFVLIRKNSYFYKSLWGAMVGDILLSTIRTCQLNKINPYEYLVAIQANAEQVQKNPATWLPWNYTQNTSSPYVNAYAMPKEEIYSRSSEGPPIITPVAPSNIPEKKTLRERCKDFYREFYPRRPKKNQTLHPC